MGDALFDSTRGQYSLQKVSDIQKFRLFPHIPTIETALSYGQYSEYILPLAFGGFSSQSKPSQLGDNRVFGGGDVSGSFRLNCPKLRLPIG